MHLDNAKKEKIIIIGVVVVALIGGVVFAFTRGGNTSKTVITKVAAQRGNISNAISGYSSYIGL